MIDFDCGQVASDRSQEEGSCDDAVSDATECKVAPAAPILLNENEEAEAEESKGWFSTMWDYFG